MNDEKVIIELPADLAYKARDQLVPMLRGATATQLRAEAQKNESKGLFMSAARSLIHAALLELPERPRPIQVGNRVMVTWGLRNSETGHVLGIHDNTAWLLWVDGFTFVASLSDLTVLPDEASK